MNRKEEDKRPGVGNTNDLVKAISEFKNDARLIIEKIDTFEMAWNLARHRYSQPNVPQHPPTTKRN